MKFNIFDSNLFQSHYPVTDEQSLTHSQLDSTSTLPARSPSPFKFDTFSLLSQVGGIETLRTTSPPLSQPREDLQPLRASPEPYIEFTEEDRTRYALAIWHARYNGNWVASIFPPSYVDAPSIILKDVCEKAVDSDLMTFNMFEQYLLHPEMYPAAYDYKVAFDSSAFY